MLRSLPGRLQQNAATKAPGLTAVLVLVPALTMGGNRLLAAQPAYTLAAGIRGGYRLGVPSYALRNRGYTLMREYRDRLCSLAIAAPTEERASE